MKAVDLIEGVDTSDGAISREDLEKLGLDSFEASKILAKVLGQIAGIPKKGYGVGVVTKENGECSVVGFKMEGDSVEA